MYLFQSTSWVVVEWAVIPARIRMAFIDLVRNVCTAGTEACYRRSCTCFLRSHNLSYSHSHPGGAGLWRSCSKSTCSLAADKRELSVGVGLLPRPHWPHQDWSPWPVRTCVLSLGAVCAEIQPACLRAASVTVHCAHLPQKLWAMLDVRSYYTLLPRLRCLPCSADVLPLYFKHSRDG